VAGKTATPLIMKIQSLSKVMPLPSVSCFITDASHEYYLWSQRLKNHYYMPNYFQFPGGMIEHGETIREASLREAREETGFHLLEYKGVICWDEAVDSDGGHWICAFNWLVCTEKKIPKNPEPKKHAPWQWRPINLPMFKPHLFGSETCRKRFVGAEK
jgi:8-oxo-dGTP pyrophosphatase MutT (NUDIX family)